MHERRLLVALARRRGDEGPEDEHAGHERDHDGLKDGWRVALSEGARDERA